MIRRFVCWLTRLCPLMVLLGLVTLVTACGGTASQPPEQRTVQPNVATTRSTVFTTTKTGALAALSADTGQPFWQTPTSDHLAGSPAFDASEHLVYAAGQASGEPIFAFDARTGQQVWRTLLAPNTTALASPPVVDVPHRLVFTSSGATLVALNAHTGAPVWQKQTGAITHIGDLLLAESALYFDASGAAGNFFLAVDTQTGRTLWSYETPDQARFGPQATYSAAAGLVYVVARGSTGNGDRLLALNGQTGQPVWQFQPGPLLQIPFAAANGLVYLQTVSPGTLFALNTQSGAVVWKAKTGITSALIRSAPRVAGDVVYAGTEPSAAGASDGGVSAYNASRGSLIWQVNGTASVGTTPGVGLGLVCLAFSDNVLHALAASTGATVWTFPSVLPNTTPILAAVSLLP